MAEDGVTVALSLFHGGLSPIVGLALQACTEARAQPADVVYWPSEWWHQSLNTGRWPGERRLAGEGGGAATGQPEPRSGPAALVSVSYSGMHVDDSVRYGFARDLLAGVADGRFGKGLARALMRCLGVVDEL
eukprot:g91.t1